jgi:hypothetical protein
MSNRKYRFAFLLLAFFVCASLTAPVDARLQSSREKKEAEKLAKDAEKESKKKSKKSAGTSTAPTATGTPALWADRGDVASLNLLLGIGSEEGKPKAPFTFDKEDMTGTNPKIKVIDANGVKWNIKFDEEVHAEVAASRIVWAVGYMVEESYFMPSGRVEGVSGLGRAKKFVGADGSFTNGMFEKRPDNIARRRNNWTWESNPFRGTKELSGLAILNAMLNNWDAKSTNNNVLGMFDADGTTVKEWYLVADWGAAFGKMGSLMSKSKWDLAAFQSQAFLDGVSGNELRLHYSGKMGSSLKSIPLEHARWFSKIVSQLTDQQLQDAFRAAGATQAEVDGFSRRLRAKITELKTAVGG